MCMVKVLPTYKHTRVQTIKDVRRKITDFPNNYVLADVDVPLRKRTAECN